MAYLRKNLIHVAEDYATQQHNAVNQVYADYLPYTFHLNLVAQVAKKYEVLIPKEDFQMVVAACKLHDVLEDTHTTYGDLVNYLYKNGGESICDSLQRNKVEVPEGSTFSELVNKVCVNVAEIVFAVTNSKGRTRKERADEAYYEGIKAVKYATFVKLCDRIANVLFGSMFKGSMLEKYRTENSEFIKALTSPELVNYSKMVADLDILFTTGTFNFNKLELK